MRSTWLSPRALGLHATVLVVVPGFLWLGWWQLHRALGGNALSWAYTVEWPFFSAYAIVMWWRLVHDVARDRTQRAADDAQRAHDEGPGALPRADPPDLGFEPTGQRVAAGSADPHDEEMAAYNSYLASLHAGDRSAAGRGPSAAPGGGSHDDA